MYIYIYMYIYAYTYISPSGHFAPDNDRRPRRSIHAAPGPGSPTDNDWGICFTKFMACLPKMCDILFIFRYILFTKRRCLHAMSSWFVSILVRCWFPQKKCVVYTFPNLSPLPSLTEFSKAKAAQDKSDHHSHMCGEHVAVPVPKMLISPKCDISQAVIGLGALTIGTFNGTILL